MMSHNNSFLKQLEAFAPLSGKTVCVALSGGADSVYLLHKLAEYSANFEYRVTAAHINHNLRGAESDRDAVFCKELCEKLAVPLKLFEIDVISKARKGESIEEAARRLRYDALFSVECDYIATAHHLDDNVETVLINMLRGTGLKGFCGIPRRRDKIIRPLLEFSKEDILTECNENGWDFVTDSTNNSDDYTRNLLRHKVTPVLRQINPSFSRVFSRNLQLLKQDRDYLETASKKLYMTVKTTNGLDIKALKNEHTAILSRVVQAYCKEVSGITADMTHLEEFVRIIRAGQGSYELSKGYRAVANGKFFVLEKPLNKNFSATFEVVYVENINNYLKINNLLLKNVIDYDKICGEFSVRTRKEKDKMRLFGRGITKSLRRLQQEKRIPDYLRDELPLAADEEGVFWAHKIGIAERVAADSKTKNLLIFSVSEN